MNYQTLRSTRRLPNPLRCVIVRVMRFVSLLFRDDFGLQAGDRLLSDDQANRNEFKAPKKYHKIRIPSAVRLRNCRRDGGSFGSFRDNDIDDGASEKADEGGSESASTQLTETPTKPEVRIYLFLRLSYLNAS